MTTPQRDEAVEETKRLNVSLEYAVMHIRLCRRRQVARRSVRLSHEVGASDLETKSSPRAAAQDGIASMASSIRAEARKLKADATAALAAAKGKTEEELIRKES